MALSNEQKNQLQDLVYYTILPALAEDLSINTADEEREAIECLVEELRRIKN